MNKRHHLPRVLLLVETTGSFGRGVVQGIGRYAQEHGPWQIHYQYRALDSMPPQWLQSWRGDGIISRTINSRQANMLKMTKIPLVELHGDPKFGVSDVIGDVSMDARMVADHFMDCGLRRFGYFSFGNAWWSKVIRDDFCKELQTRGYDIFSYMPDTKEQDFVVWDESQRPLIKKWLRSLPRPIGIFTPGDLHSVCLLDICIELKIAVPEEVAILGRGNDPVICETVHPTLSSLDLNPQRLGYEAAKMLDQRMAKKKINEVVRIPPNFIAIRQSTNMMAIEDVDVAQALQYIRQFACKGIDVAQLVDHVGLSRRTLETRFSQMLGRSPKAEIIRIQIEHAKKLLTNTDKTSKNIARLCGFSSLEYFTIAFRREVGMKPQAYRKTRVIPHDTSSIPKRSDAGS